MHRVESLWETEKMSRCALEVVNVSSCTSISRETIEYIVVWHSTPLLAIRYFCAWLLPPVTESTK
jgi:hypothetical protein